MPCIRFPSSHARALLAWNPCSPRFLPLPTTTTTAPLHSLPMGYLFDYVPSKRSMMFFASIICAVCNLVLLWCNEKWQVYMVSEQGCYERDLVHSLSWLRLLSPQPSAITACCLTSTITKHPPFTHPFSLQGLFGFGFAHGVIYVVQCSMARILADMRIAAAFFGIVNSICNLMHAFGTAIGGPIAEHLDLEANFLAGAIVDFAALAFCLLLPEEGLRLSREDAAEKRWKVLPHRMNLKHAEKRKTALNTAAVFADGYIKKSLSRRPSFAVLDGGSSNAGGGGIISSLASPRKPFLDSSNHSSNVDQFDSVFDISVDDGDNNNGAADETLVVLTARGDVAKYLAAVPAFVPVAQLDLPTRSLSAHARGARRVSMRETLARYVEAGKAEQSRAPRPLGKGKERAASIGAGEQNTGGGGRKRSVSGYQQVPSQASAANDGGAMMSSLVPGVIRRNSVAAAIAEHGPRAYRPSMITGSTVVANPLAALTSGAVRWSPGMLASYQQQQQEQEQQDRDGGDGGGSGFGQRAGAGAETSQQQASTTSSTPSTQQQLQPQQASVPYAGYSTQQQYHPPSSLSSSSLLPGGAVSMPAKAPSRPPPLAAHQQQNSSSSVGAPVQLQPPGIHQPPPLASYSSSSSMAGTQQQQQPQQGERDRRARAAMAMGHAPHPAPATAAPASTDAAVTSIGSMGMAAGSPSGAAGSFLPGSYSQQQYQQHPQQPSWQQQPTHIGAPALSTSVPVASPSSAVTAPPPVLMASSLQSTASQQGPMYR